MGALSAAILGIVQGVTEFLPISSSAHLILARAWFGWDAGPFALPFDVACHVGTLVAVVAYFRRDLADMARGVLRVTGSEGGGEAARQVWLLAVGTLPVVVIGLAFGELVEGRLRTPGVAGVALAVGAVVFVVVERGRPGTRFEASLSGWEAVLIGVGQASALVPGVSRSGATIIAGLILGMRREAAARFGFLLGIPAILAATIREGLALRGTAVTPEMAAWFAIGAVSSGVIGYVTVKYFLRYLVGHSLDVFALYRLLLAAAVMLPFVR